MRKICWMILAYFLISAVPGYGAEIPLFKKYNPDIDKYSFAKSYIVALGYYNRVALRLKDEAAISSAADLKTIQAFIDDRTLDNTELRIAKNYLVKFFELPNGMIQKVAHRAVGAYEKLLVMSVKERDLWLALYRFKDKGEPADFDEAKFAEDQIALARDKKEVAKELLEASVLLRVVMLSAERCDSEDCKALALTADERFKLSEKLDSFARENTAWGVKAGQTTIEACVAAIREVLEDRVYESQPQ